jgi:hypothetical protein
MRVKGSRQIHYGVRCLSSDLLAGMSVTRS